MIGNYEEQKDAKRDDDFWILMDLREAETSLAWILQEHLGFQDIAPGCDIAELSEIE